MKFKPSVRLLVAAVIVGVAPFCTAFAQSGSRYQLRFIVQQLCLTHWRLTRDPAPCMRLTVNGDGADTQGFALLADRKGGAHLLLIPVASISGIESGAVRVRDAFNFFDAAWQARDALAGMVGYRPARATIGLAVNPIRGRSQDQLHIHIACLNPSVFRALQDHAAKLGTAWSTIRIGTVSYEALRIMGGTLGKHNPFELLATHVPGSNDQIMGRYTLLVAGMSYQEGPGFVLLAGDTHVPPAELLLDGSCSVLRRRPN